MDQKLGMETAGFISINESCQEPVVTSTRQKT